MLIEKISNPKRKMKHKGSQESNNNEFELKFDDYFQMGKEMKQKLNEEIKSFQPLYEKEIQNIKLDKKHAFMMNHFPEMYNLVNYYYFIKKNKDRKDDLSKGNNITVKELTTEHKKTSLRNKNNLWTPNNDEKFVENYLFQTEKNWPVNLCSLSQEVALELLKQEKYNSKEAIKLIVMNHEKFLNLLIKHNKFSNKKVKGRVVFYKF